MVFKKPTKIKLIETHEIAVNLLVPMPYKMRSKKRC